MGQGAAAGVAYACAAFAVGFAVGAFRVIVVEPRLGAVTAVAVELPLMLAVSWLIARAVVRRMRLDGKFATRFEMGVAGLVLLVALEMGLGMLFGMPLAAQIAEYASARGILTLLGQLGFALIPLFV